MIATRYCNVDCSLVAWTAIGFIGDFNRFDIKWFLKSDLPPRVGLLKKEINKKNRNTVKETNRQLKRLTDSKSKVSVSQLVDKFD